MVEELISWFVEEGSVTLSAAAYFLGQSGGKTVSVAADKFAVALPSRVFAGCAVGYTGATVVGNTAHGVH